MRRREFITLLGGAAVAWPLAARAQQPEGTRRIGVLMNRVADDPEGQARLKALVQGLQQLGWVEGRKCGWTCVGQRALPTAFTGTRQNWSHSCRRSFWPMAPSA